MIRPIMKDEFFLAQKSVPAVNCEEDLQVARDLLETLEAHKEGCVGLAANMIGVSKRIIAFDNEGTYMVMFNPEILKQSEPYDTEEGCLSLPGIHEPVKRPARIRVQWLDENLEAHDEWVEGFLARVMQHEFDHLDGKVFTDRIAPLRKQMVKSKLAAIMKGKVACRYRTK